MERYSLTAWQCELYRILHLANPVVHSWNSRILEIALEDLDDKRKYVVQFTDVLGYRFETHFYLQRLMNTFKVPNSPWIEDMLRKSGGVEDLQTAQHYLISTMNGEFEVVAKEEPSIHTIAISPNGSSERGQDDGES